MSDRGAEHDARAPQPRGVLGMHLPTGKMFLRRVFTCGYCGHQFKQHLSNGFRACPRCWSRKKVNHTEPGQGEQ